MKAKVGNASISVERGDITDREVDALVNPANTALTMTTGVAAAIKRKGGVIIEEEAMRQGPVEVGEALLTPGGNLQATHVIHAVVMGPDLKTDAEVVGRATRAALVVADKHRLTSIAMPALGTGLGHVDLALAQVVGQGPVQALRGDDLVGAARLSPVRDRLAAPTRDVAADIGPMRL